MESNYVKSARIKLAALGITDYKTFKQHGHEIFKIIDDAHTKEYNRVIRESKSQELIMHSFEKE